MNTAIRIATAALGFAVAQAFAQSADVPKNTCEPKPSYPGAKAMKSEVEVKQFEKQMADYKECVVAYISARILAIVSLYSLAALFSASALAFCAALRAEMYATTHSL